MKAELEHTLAECRDAYPAPEVGSELEGLWGQAMSNPASVGAYVKACATSQQKEIDELRAELEAMKIADNPEKWWKCSAHGPAKAGAWGCPECVSEMRAELERIKSLEPVAWIRPSGKAMLEAGGYCTVYASDGMSNHSTALYALGSKTA